MGVAVLLVLLVLQRGGGGELEAPVATVHGAASVRGGLHGDDDAVAAVVVAAVVP